MSKTQEANTKGFRLALKQVCSRTDFAKNGQYVHTPFDLCHEMVDKLERNTGLFDKTFLTINLEFVEVLCYDFGIAKEKIWFVTDCQQKANIIKHERYKGVNVILTDSYLTWEPNMKFDVIVGNPPYQDTDENGNSLAGGGIKLWERFLRHSIELLKNDGYLCYLHPSGWRNYGSKVFSEIFQAYAVKYVNILTAEKHFDVGSKFDWYVLQKSNPTKNTVVEWNTEKKTVDISTIKGLPSMPIMFGILDKFSKESCYLDCQRIQTHHNHRDHMSQSKKKGFIYPIQHTLSDGIWWSNLKHPFQNKKKVVMFRSGYLTPSYDNGKLGTSDGCFFILVSSKKEGKYIIRLLNSKLYRCFVYQSKTSGFNDLKVLRLLPYPKYLPDNFTDEDVYKYFNLTPEEIALVEETTK